TLARLEDVVAAHRGGGARGQRRHQTALGRRAVLRRQDGRRALDDGRLRRITELEAVVAGWARAERAPDGELSARLHEILPVRAIALDLRPGGDVDRAARHLHHAGGATAGRRGGVQLARVGYLLREERDSAGALPAIGVDL